MGRGSLCFTVPGQRVPGRHPRVPGGAGYHMAEPAARIATLLVRTLTVLFFVFRFRGRTPPCSETPLTGTQNHMWREGSGLGQLLTKMPLAESFLSQEERGQNPEPRTEPEESTGAGDSPSLQGPHSPELPQGPFWGASACDPQSHGHFWGSLGLHPFDLHTHMARKHSPNKHCEHHRRP